MFDLHVHSAPCLLPRIAGDVQTVAWYERAGFTGCVLKGHFESTVGRAQAAAFGRRIAVHGGIVLNTAVGGLEPAVVAASLELGARVVWMPTIDARAHRLAGLPRPPGSRDHDLALPPLELAAELAVQRILSLVAEADAVLATGHLSRAETAWLIPQARAAGIGRILLTHASFTVPGLTAVEARELAELGAHVEVTAFQLLHQERMTAAQIGAFVREVGCERCVLSSDAGQPDSPPAPEALQLLVEELVRAGLDRGAAESMASDVPQALVTP